MPRAATAIILAAGHGTRMRSDLPKTLHKIAGRPMLSHLLASVDAVFDRAVVVIGPGMDDVAACAAPHPSVIQHDRRGTAHAALQAAPQFGDGDVAILYADNPLIRPETLSALLDRRRETGAALALLAMRPADPARYGRVIVRDDDVEKIVEWADATEAERATPLCNAGVMAADSATMMRLLERVRPNNAANEYYLTDIVALARAEGGRVIAVEAPHDELRGVNSRAELAEAEAVVQRALRLAAMDGGATLTDPATVFLCADTRLGRDVAIGPNVVFGPGVTVADGVVIGAFSHLEGCVIGPGAIVGPFARIRPGSALERGAHVGNFVELKATRLGAGAKANHLTYLGDADVGERANIGAGTITCNYDGVHKHRTTIGEGAFIGSDSALVAPVSVGDRAITAAGSVITGDVPADALAIGRSRQVNKPGRATALRRPARKD